MIVMAVACVPSCRQLTCRDVAAGSATRSSFTRRYILSLCVLVYAVLMGCVRTAALGYITVLNPITGEQAFATDLHVNVHSSSVRALRQACAAALALFAYVISFAPVVFVALSSECACANVFLCCNLPTTSPQVHAVTTVQ